MKMKWLVGTILVVALSLPQAGGASGSEDSCFVRVSKEMGVAPTKTRPFYTYREIGYGEKALLAKGALQSGEFALTFDLGGRLRLFYGDREIFLNRESEMSHTVSSISNPMDFRDFDLALIYTNLNGVLQKDIENLFRFHSDRVPRLVGYNCEDAVCQLMVPAGSPQENALVFEPERLFDVLLSLKDNHLGYTPQIFVSQRVGSPLGFFRQLMERRTEDKFSRSEKKAAKVFKKFIFPVLAGTAITLEIGLLVYMLFFAY